MVNKSKKNKISKLARPIAIDLFSGAGGMSLGFEQAGFDIVLAIDNDGNHIATHARNFPYGKSLCKSITDIVPSEILNLLNNPSDIDLILAGPPCQGFSPMGIRDNKDPRNTLVDEFARVVTGLMPRAFVMENVPGMSNGKTKSILERFISDLEHEGYKITKPVITLDASDFGVPQKRRRLFVLGIREDISNEFPYPFRPEGTELKKTNVWEAIGDLPKIEEYPELLEEDLIPYDKEPEGHYAKIARGFEVDPFDFSYIRKWNSSICSGCIRTRHQRKTQQLYAATEPGQMAPGHKLPRLDPMGMSPTLRAGTDSSRGSHTAPRPIHPFKPRVVTIREAARLSGFPDWFSFFPAKWHAYRQIGNAVVPHVARAIGTELIEQLGYIQAKPYRKIILVDNFTLPKASPRTKQRIQLVTNYVLVIDYLTQSILLDSTKYSQKFTFDDVKEAILKTKANIPWARKDIFLSDIARSRHVKKILAPCRKLGYSIRPVASEGFIGEFVPLGTSGALETKDTLKISSTDVKSSVLITPTKEVDLKNSLKVAKLVEEKALSDLIWKSEIERARVAKVQRIGNRDLFGGKIDLVGKGGKEDFGSFVLISMSGITLSKSLIRKLLSDKETKEAILLVPITKKHVIVYNFVFGKKEVKEKTKFVIELESHKIIKSL